MATLAKKRKPTGANFGNKPGIPWEKAELIEIPIDIHERTAKSNRPFGIAARIQIVRAKQAWHWRIALEASTYEYGFDALRNDTRRPAESRAKAELAACDALLREFACQADFATRNGIRSLARALGEAMNEIRQFRDDTAFNDEGKPPATTSPLTFDPKARKNASTALVPARDVPTVCKVAGKLTVPPAIDVPSTAVDENEPLRKLTAAEEKRLCGYEGQIKQSYLVQCRALAAIIAEKLWEGRAASALVYAQKTFGWDRSRAYRAIHIATEVEPVVSAIADKLDLEITNELQFRKLEKLTGKSEIEPVLRKTAHKLKFAHLPGRAPAAKLIEEAVEEFTEAPDDLRRKREEARLRDKKPAPATKQTEWEDLGETQEEEHLGAAFRGEGPQKSLGYSGDEKHLWNGRMQIWAEDLHGLREAVLSLLAPMFERHGHDKDFLYAAAMLLHDLSSEAKYREPAAAGTAARRAK